LNFFLVTGLYRSGTTLLEKLLLQHPAISIASQPYPGFYHYLKKRFNELHGIASVYPVNTRMGDEYFAMYDFTSFLKTYKIGERDKQELGIDIGENSPATFIELFRELQSLAVKKQISDTTMYAGSKEILCEEYIGMLLENGVRVVHIVRDPRDVLCSTAFGKEYTGKIRPSLYTIRMWRKSVAFRMHYSEHPLFYSLTYEELVNAPQEAMNALTNFFGIGAMEVQPALKDQQGNVWKSNSSFIKSEQITSVSVGNYQKVFNPDFITYVTTLCAPELNYLRYKCKEVMDIKNIFEGFKEPFPVDHELFQPDYSTSGPNRAMELKRAELLKTDEVSLQEIERYYQFESVYKILQKHAPKN